VVKTKTIVMTIKEFVLNGQTNAFIGNPELAEAMRKMSKNILSEALEGKDSRKMSTDQFMSVLVTYFVGKGLSFDNISWVIKTGTSTEFRDTLRREYDEEYVEYGFLAIEDGGRGEEF
jgi:hypothetical protein